MSKKIFITTPDRIKAMINKIISDGCDYESGGGFDCFLIVLIRFILFASRYSPAHQRVGQSIARSLDLSLALSIAPSQGARHKKESANRVQTGGIFPRAWVMAERFKNNFFREQGPDGGGVSYAHGLWQKDSNMGSLERASITSTPHIWGRRWCNFFGYKY